ncbi:EAP30/Vps36 family-domain-containing protein [Powellomyces hirtus]|nr:EAP30/Vps36 family-domain-containing protein [Powellomyces hirtus]
MDCFSTVPLNPDTHRPTLLPGETIALLQSDVGLYSGKTRLQDYDNGIAFVTGLRIMWVDEARDTALQLPLTALRGIDTSGGIWKASSPKLILTLQRQAPLAGSATPTSQPSSATSAIATTSTTAVPWTCPICAHLNSSGDHAKCDLCGVQKPAGLSSSQPTPACRDSPAISAPSPAATSASSSSPTRSPNFQITPTSYTYPSLFTPTSPPTPPPKTTSTLQKQCPVCTFLNHADLITCEMCDAPLPGPRPAANLPSPAVDASSGPAQDTSATTDDDTTSIVKLSFRAGGLSEFVKALKAAVADRAWERAVTPISKASVPAPVQSSPGLGGIASIMRSVEQSNQQMGSSVDEAFSDLNALMAKAADMVKLAESISSKIAQSTALAADDDDSSEMAAFRSYLIDLGISNPVTKKSTGDLYTQELTRQLAEFLARALPRHGGMMALTDLYCLFNRARGSALISPNDLRACCTLFEGMNLPFRVREFASGLLVVQSSTHRDDETVARVHAHVVRRAHTTTPTTTTTPTMGGGLAAADLAALEKVSIVLAAEQLLLAESKGLLCRDDTIEGLRFFDNIITGYVLPPLLP